MTTVFQYLLMALDKGVPAEEDERAQQALASTPLSAALTVAKESGLNTIMPPDALIVLDAKLRGLKALLAVVNQFVKFVAETYF